MDSSVLCPCLGSVLGWESRRRITGLFRYGTPAAEVEPLLVLKRPMKQASGSPTTSCWEYRCGALHWSFGWRGPGSVSVKTALNIPSNVLPLGLAGAACSFAEGS